MKICKYCKWYKDEVCVNSDSYNCSDFVSWDDSCEEYEEVEDGS